MSVFIFLISIFSITNDDLSSNTTEGDALLLNNLKYRSVGPIRGGRVTTVHGVTSERNTFYMGTTGGGVWKTNDAGLNWFNISDGFYFLSRIVEML